MLAIFKRDFRSYFTSPIGYVFIAVFLLVSNLFFYMINVLNMYSDLSALFSNLLFVLMFIIPLLTMRLLSEEMKQRTDQMLLTAPVKIVDIVVGKFLAAFSVFLIGIALTFTWPLIVTMFGTPAVYTIIGNYVALIFAIATFISIGLFISSLTESQIIAAIVSFCVFLGIYFMSALGSALDSPIISKVLNWFSIFSRYSNFTLGIFSLADIVYYISVTVVFLFLTTRVIEKKRWA
ncbi:MAG: ABC transporter permease subunit [Clostridiales bacterium]|nr:ABC transporter permease subunit [Clostridiales bacterium]